MCECRVSVLNERGAIKTSFCNPLYITAPYRSVWSLLKALQVQLVFLLLHSGNEHIYLFLFVFYEKHGLNSKHAQLTFLAFLFKGEAEAVRLD